MKSSCILLLLYTISFRSSTVRAFSRAPFPAAPTVTCDPIPTEAALKMEATVRRYFEGVHTKDPDKIRSCFGETATIRDVCGLQSGQRTVTASELVALCMDFVTAHPDCAINFYYGPECGRTSGGWVVAHWFETGTWLGDSCGIPATGAPMACEGQTRFLVDPDSLKIQEFVVTRTFTEWEKDLIEKQKVESSTQFHINTSILTLATRTTIFLECILVRLIQGGNSKRRERDEVNEDRVRLFG